MKKRVLSHLCFVLSTLFSSEKTLAQPYLQLANNEASAAILKEVYKKISDLPYWGGIQLTSFDCNPDSTQMGDEWGQILLTDSPDYSSWYSVTLQVYRIQKATSEGLQAFFNRLKDSPMYYIKESFINDSAAAFLGALNPPLKMWSNGACFENPSVFAVACKGQVPAAFSIMDDAAANVFIGNTTDFSNLPGLSFSNNYEFLTDAPIISILQKAMGCDQSIFVGISFAKGTGITSAVAAPLGEFLKKLSPQPIFNFDLSGAAQDDSNALMRAIMNNLVFAGDAKNGYAKYKSGSLSGFSENEWSFFLNHFDSVDLSQNQLGDSMDAFAAALANKPASNRFWWALGKNNIDDAGAVTFFNALGAYTAANHPTYAFFLGFGGNPIGDAGVNAMIQYFQDFGTYVRDCPWNQINLDKTELSSENWVKLFNALQVMDLASISLKGCNLSEPETMTALAQLYKKSPKLWFMNLRHASITDASITAFSNALTGALTLPAYMYLSHNQIGDDGATALADMLTTLKTTPDIALYLSSNQIGTAGATALIQANAKRVVASPGFFNNKNIDVDALLPAYLTCAGGGIDLSGLGVTDEQAVKLAEIIKQNPVFNGLVVNNNKIGDVGMEALGTAMTYSLQQVTAKQAKVPTLRVQHPDFDRVDYAQVNWQKLVKEAEDRFRKENASFFNACSVQ